MVGSVTDFFVIFGVVLVFEVGEELGFGDVACIVFVDDGEEGGEGGGELFLKVGLPCGVFGENLLAVGTTEKILVASEVGF